MSAVPSPHAIPAPRGGGARDGRGALLWTLACVVLLLAGWRLSALGFYSPGSDAGYYMGLAGALMMLALLGYPLRKRLRFLEHAGALKWWFRTHMILGIAGPMLVLLHSTFRIGSVNAGVALFCMLLVAGSGIIGRFLYARIHKGLYGSQSSLADLRAELDRLAAEIHSGLEAAAAIAVPLDRFAARVQSHDAGALRRAWEFATVGWHARRTLRACKERLKPALRERARKERWPREKLRRRYAESVASVRSYLECGRRAAQFRGYERLFALWHVAHVPFVYMLAASAVVHVVAVHMY